MFANSTMGHALGDFTFSPILTASSARPFNMLVGVDNVGTAPPGQDEVSADARTAETVDEAEDE